MELSPITGQVSNIVNNMQPRAHAPPYLVDLFLREILEVGVGGHDGHRKPDRYYVFTAQHTPTGFPAVER